MNSNDSHLVSPMEMASSLIRNRSLIWRLTEREVIGRYRGSVIGLVWSFFNPLLMLTVYTFVFSVVFKSKWPTQGTDDKGSFAIILFAGMLIQAVFAEGLLKSTSVILSNTNYVKKVVFPLEVLPWVGLGSTMFHTMVSTFVLLVAQIILNHVLPWTVVFFPLVLVPLILGTIGVMWLFASVGVFLRDLGQVTGIMTTIIMFVSPVFYPVSALPAAMQSVMKLNPLTFIIEQTRAVLIFSQLPDWLGLCESWLISAVVAWVGFAWFQKTRKGFADVL